MAELAWPLAVVLCVLAVCATAWLLAQELKRPDLRPQLDSVRRGLEARCEALESRTSELASELRKYTSEVDARRA